MADLGQGGVSFFGYGPTGYSGGWELRPKWHRLTYRLPIEGNMLGTIHAKNVNRCREICDMVPGCNSFAREKSYGRSSLWDSSDEGGGTVVYHLKARCAAPGSPETRLDAPDASGSKGDERGTMKVTRLRGRYISHYKWPCSSETVWGS